MVGNSAKPQEPVRFSVLLKDTDKGRVNTEQSNYQDTLLNIFASQVSTAATVSLTRGHILVDVSHVCSGILS